MSATTIRIWEPSNHVRRNWPVTVSAPFARGAVTGPRQVIVRDPRSGQIPAQRRVLGTWDDGSAKWLLLDFPVDLAPRETVEFGVEIASELVGVDAHDGLRIEWAGADLRIDTGPMQLDLAADSGGLLRQLTAHGVSYGERLGTIQLRQPGGRILEGGHGRANVDLEENGPQRGVIAIRGKHSDEDGSCLDYVLRLVVYAHQPVLRWYYTIENREQGDVELANAQIIQPIDLNPSTSWAHVGTDRERYAMPEGWVSMTTDRLETRATDGHRQSGNINTIRAEVQMEPFLVVGDDERMVMFLPRWAHFLYPKAAHYYGRALRYDIWPDWAGTWTLRRGMAKTHEFTMRFAPPAESYDAAMPEVAPMLRPLVPEVPSEWIESTRSMPVFFPAKPDKYPALETRLTQTFRQRARAYGMLHFGDAPSPAYTAQGRGRRGEGEESLIWVNNEYDLPHMAMQQFLRSGDRNVWLSDVEPTIWHMMDVDSVLYDPDSPVNVGGQVTHSADHVGPPGGGVDPSHEWVEGLITYHVLTGLEHPREKALALGEHLIRWTDMYQARLGRDTTAARVSGWALIALTALYEFTHDERYLAACLEHAKGVASRIEDGIGHLTETVSYGFPYRAGFMTDLAVTGLKRLHDVGGDDRWKDLAIRMLEDQLEHLMAPTGLLWYKELPENHYPMMSLFDLEVMAYAYRWTGDKRYLEHGLRLYSLAGPLTIPFQQFGAFLNEAPEGALYERIEYYRRDAHSLLWFRFLLPFCDVLDELGLLEQFEPPRVQMPENDVEA